MSFICDGSIKVLQGDRSSKMFTVLFWEKKAKNQTQAHKPRFIVFYFLWHKRKITSSPLVLQLFLLILLGRKKVRVIWRLSCESAHTSNEMTLPSITVRTGRCMGMTVCLCVAANGHPRVLLLSLFLLHLAFFFWCHSSPAACSCPFLHKYRKCAY